MNVIPYSTLTTPRGQGVTGGQLELIPVDRQLRPAADQLQPVPQQYPQQVPVAGGSGETLILILAAAIMFTAWRKSKAMRWPIAAALVAGVLLAGSVIGPMIKQTSGSAGTQMENMVNGFGTGGTTTPSGYTSPGGYRTTP